MLLTASSAAYSLVAYCKRRIVSAIIKIAPCNEAQMIDVQYTRALYSLSNSLRLACKILEQTYIASIMLRCFLLFCPRILILHDLLFCATKTEQTPLLRSLE